MKRIFTHLFVSVLLLLSSAAWAQSVTKTITVKPSDGTFASRDNSNWRNGWTSNTSPVITIEVAGGINNLNAAVTDKFHMAEGTNGSSTWNFSVADYKILSYSFNFVSVNSSNNVTITSGSKAMTSSSISQAWAVEGLDASQVSIVLSGSNQGIYVTNLTFKVYNPSASSELTVGKVYNFENVEYSKSMTAVGTEKTAIADTELTDYTQLWYVGEGSVTGTYTLRNLGNGLYLQGGGQGSKWPFVDEPSNLYYQTAGTGFSMTANSECNAASGYWMHYGAGNYCVVGWNANSTASQWLATEVNISESDLQANWEEVALLNGASGKVAEYQGYLNNLFTDNSCTTPKKSLTSASAIEADADYQKLPTGLQAMVKKVYLGDWGESNIVSTKAAWSSKHAKRFRVQQYEPYSYAERTNSMLGIYAHSNMNNPTGLVANQRNLLYIMVEGEIKEGAKLYIQSLVGEDRLGNIGGVELTEGLNIVPYWSDGNQLFIQYVVSTYENGAKTGHKLSQYSPLKIHIEGGCINGCFDTVGDAINPADTDADWDAYEVRAHQYNFTVLGKYMMWHMPLVIDDSNTDYLDLSDCLGTNATSVKAAMDAWETIESAQRLMEGLLSEQEINTIPNASRVFEYTGNDPDEQYPSDYSEEYNNRSMAYSTKDGYFMFAADWSSHYASNTLDDVIRDIATGGDPWGPAHEIGHTYQGPINLPSTSETSNNAIANVSNWFMGRTSSRLGSTQSLLDQYNNNTSFLGTDANSGNVWEKLMMYTKLWFYYHVTGHNKKFYPRLFEMLRRDPIVRQQGVALSGTETMLKFYKFACMAAEEDLTDFFEVFGFFVPVDGTLSDDYGDFKTVMTQAEIDAAKAEVAAMAAEKGWKKNSAIIFIDDRIGTVYSHDGVTPLGARNDGGKEQGVLGSINDFDSNPDNDVAPLTGEYTYTVLNNTISMQGGTGGVGFLIYDADGNLVGFSNKYTFPLGEKAQAALASGTARVVVITDDIDAEPVEISDANSTQTQTELLAGLLPVVAELLSYEDATGTKVGWYKSSALTALNAAYNKALEIYNNKEYASYGGAYAVLYEEYNAVATSLTAKVEFVDGRTYYLKNVGSGNYMSVDGSGNVIANSTVPTATTTASLWQINAGFYDTFYSLKNQSTGTYVRKPQKEGDKYVNEQQFVLADASHAFIFEEVSTGVFAIKDRDSKKYLNYQSGKVATWGGNDTGSQWEIVYLPTDETMAQRTELEDLILLTQELIDEVGFAAYTQLKLQNDPSKANYLYCNAPHSTDYGDGIDGDYVTNLTDGKTSSFLHTVWSPSNSKDGENHYLRVDLGVDNQLDLIKFAYATRKSTNLDMPSRMLVQGSDSETTGYVTLATLTSDDAVNPLPTTSNAISWYKSDVITDGNAYRYYRFMVTETKRGLKDGYSHYAFTMSEFQLYKKEIGLNSEYNTQVNLELLDAAFEKMVKAQEAVANSAATKADLEVAYNTLSEAYEQLLTAKTTVDNSALDAEKERLSTLITSARNLVDSCKEGEFVSHGATETDVNLQATNENAVNYLYCNALYNKSAGNNNGDNSMNTYKLLDNNTETYIHTIYNAQKADDNLDHYLRIDFGENAQNGFFRFAYHTRKVSDNSVHPEVIKIEGSNSLAEGFEEIITISSGLPNKVDADYPSAVMGNGKNYRYIRLMVTDTYADAIHSTNTDDGEHKSFCLAEFDFWTVTKEYLEVTLSANCGNATETMVLDAYRAVQAAQEALAMATTAQQLQTAYSVLEAAYTVLNEAKNAVNKSELETALQNANTLLGTVTTDGVVNDYYSGSETVILSIDALNNAVTAAQEIFDAAQTTQDAIDTAKGNVETAMSALRIELDKDVPTENRTTLNSLLTQTTGLVNEIATVSTEETVIPLQCDNSDNDYYIWTNAQQPGDDNHIRNLLDTDAGTMFHSSWGNGATNVNEKHYLAIDLGKSSIKEFVFNYTTYTAWYSYCPTDITIQGSNDFVEFTDIRNLTDGDSEKPLLSTDASSDYTSMILNADGKYYRYLRFVVNENRHSGKFNEQYYFQLATFGVTSKGTTIAINGNYALSNVTADMVSAAYSEAAAVAEIAGKYMTQKQYDDACTSLQAVYTALENAKNINKATLEQALAAAIAQRETLTNTEGNLDEYWTTSTALVQAFEELNSKTETAQNVFNSKISTQKEIDDAATVLNSAVTALQNIINLDYVENDVVSRDDLRDLIAASTSLLEQVTTGEAAQFVPQELVTAFKAKKDEAANVVERYMTESDYNTILQALRQEYDALNDALSIANSKVELKRLVDETILLKNNLYETGVASYTATEVTLQCDTEGAAGYLYCNAPGERNYWDDGLGVKALLDKKTDGTDNTETYMHTPYDTNLDDNKDGLDHYLRVDLGTEGAVAYLEFGYVCRDGYTSLTPSTVVVEATNDLTAKWTTIKTLTLARPSTTAETKTGALGNGVAYRYWRFMVTATHDGRECNGHPYFALSDFNVYKCTDVVLDSQLKSEYTPNIHMYTTAELVAEVEGAINDANTVCNDANTTIDDCNSEKEALQAEYDKLADAIKYYWTPVVLTTDEANPALYTINAPGRSDANNSKAWQYNAQNNNITIVNKDDTNLYHLWYFIEGDEEHTVKIVPVMTPEYTLGATDFNHGENKVSAVAESDVDWSFDYVGNYYNFKAHGKNVYISNYGGGSKALGFYGVDNGSYVSFSEVEVENYALARLTKLSSLHNNTAVTGTDFGCFTQETGGTYNNAVTSAAELVASASTDNAACVDAFTALYNANNNLELVLPTDETVLCTITNVARTGGKMFANGETEPVLCWDNNDVTAKYIFTFEPTGEKGKYYMKSLERGTYVSTAKKHGKGVENIAAAKDTAIVVTIANMSPTSRAVSITPVGGAMLHADASGNANKVVAWDNAAADGASAWLLDEVTDLSQVTHTVSLGANESGADKNAYSTLYLEYNAKIPDGVTASIVTAVEDDDRLAMTPVTGGILPANTAVVLSGSTAGDVSLKYTAEESDFDTTGNILKGTSYNKLVKCGDEYNVYMLGKKSGRVAFYWTYENRGADGNYVYINADEEIVASTATGAHRNHNKGGYVRCNANKAYLLERENSGQAAAAMYSLPIGGNATGVDDVKGENAEVKTIYDLQGRKLVKITEPGFYIVNGNKIYVTEVED